MDRIVLGSRGSALALAQVRLVKEALLRAHPGLKIDVEIITTSGDRRQDARVGHVDASGLKGLFTKEIQDALLDGLIHAAIHSLKDLPGVTPSTLGIAAVLPRADTSDLLISRSGATLATLKTGARIGTSSVRRCRQILWLRGGIEIVEIRGNVPTRLEKLAAGSLDAIVLARAGLERLGYNINSGLLDCSAGTFHTSALDMLPAIGQGAVGIETLADNNAARALLAPIDHAPTHTCIRVERELLRLLNGDCRLPVGARVTLDEASTLHGEAAIFLGNEAMPPTRARATGPASDPEGLANRLFDQLS